MTIGAGGLLTDLHIAPTAFDRTSPGELAGTVGDLVRRGTLQVRQRTAELMRPLTEDLPNLSDVVDGAPSFQDVVPTIPEYPASESLPPNSYSPSAPLRTGDPDSEDLPNTWLQDGH